MATSTIETVDQRELEALEELFGEGQLGEVAAEAELKIGDSDVASVEAIVASVSPIPVIWTIIFKC